MTFSANFFPNPCWVPAPIVEFPCGSVGGPRSGHDDTTQQERTSPCFGQCRGSAVIRRRDGSASGSPAAAWPPRNGAGRRPVLRRNQRLNCEALEGRQMLSGFYIVNMESGLALDDTNFSTSNGNLIQQWQPTGGLNQRWNLVSLPDGNDEIVNAYSGKVLDDTDFSTSNGTQIQQWQATGGLNQQWNFVSLADGNDEIVNAYSGKALDDTNFSTSNGTMIQQWQSTGGLNQQWRLLAAGNAPTVTNYVVDASSGKVLDDTNFSTSNGNHHAAVAAHRRVQPAVDVHLARRRQRSDRQRGQRQGARRHQLVDQQRRPRSSSGRPPAGSTSNGDSSPSPTATTRSSTRTAARCSTTRTPRPATATRSSSGRPTAGSASTGSCWRPVTPQP